MTTGSWSLLSDVIAAFPADHPQVPFWRRVLMLGDAAVVFPDFSRVMWVITQTPEQEAVFLAIAGMAHYMFNQHTQIVSLDMLNRTFGFTTVAEAAQHLIEVGKRCAPPEERDAETTDEIEPATDGYGPASRDQGGTGQGPLHRGGEPEGDEGRTGVESGQDLPGTTEG